MSFPWLFKNFQLPWLFFAHFHDFPWQYLFPCFSMTMGTMSYQFAVLSLSLSHTQTLTSLTRCPWEHNRDAWRHSPAQRASPISCCRPSPANISVVALVLGVEEPASRKGLCSKPRLSHLYAKLIPTLNSNQTRTDDLLSPTRFVQKVESKIKNSTTLFKNISGRLICLWHLYILLKNFFFTNN